MLYLLLYPIISCNLHFQDPMDVTPKTTLNNRSMEDPGTPIAYSTPDTSPKPRKIRGFKVRKLILPGCEMDDVPEEDIIQRPELCIFNLRCIRQTNDVVLLHKMIQHYNSDFKDLNNIEFRYCTTIMDAIYDRLLELHCKCIDCDDYRCELSDLLC